MTKAKEIKLDNPAARLYALLLEADGFPENESMLNVWSKILKIPSSNNRLPTYYQYMSQVLLLPNQVKKLVQENEFDVEPDPSNIWGPPVDKLFNVSNTGVPWAPHYNKHININVLSSLSMTASLFRANNVGVDNCLPSDFDTLIEAVQEVKIIVESSTELNDSFKMQMDIILEDILLSASSYKITGVSPVLESIKSGFGNALFDTKYGAHLFKTKDGQAIASKLGNATLKVLNLIGAGSLKEGLEFTNVVKGLLENKD